jgi:hypothetical protein
MPYSVGCQEVEKRFIPFFPGMLPPRMSSISSGDTFLSRDAPDGREALEFEI